MTWKPEAQGPLRGVYRDITPAVMGKNIEHEMATGIMWGFLGARGFQTKGTFLGVLIVLYIVMRILVY